MVALKCGCQLVYAVNLDEECLLDFSYLVQSRTCVDFRQKLVRGHGHEVPLLPEVSCAEVTAERLHLAPRTEHRVQC